jgi:hypothetical protein
MSGLLLRRASVYRPGHWDDDDYDVHQDIGRIFRAEAGHPAETPWIGPSCSTNAGHPDRIRVSR